MGILLSCDDGRRMVILFMLTAVVVLRQSGRLLIDSNCFQFLQQILAPFTDLHYRLRAEDGQRYCYSYQPFHLHHQKCDVRYVVVDS